MIILEMLLLFCITSCKEEEPVSLIPDIYSGTATALKNSEEWSGFTRSQKLKTNRISIIVNTFSSQGFLRETLGIGSVKPYFERQNIKSIDGNGFTETSAGYGTWIDDGDVGGDSYGLDTTVHDSFIHITSYNPNNAEIEGIFKVSLILEREGNQTPGKAPEKLVFTEGTFTVKVDPEWFE
ncbi:MAG: hypothetical protein RLN88_09460 [Ekhidna sp.]|uniref:hypothetical protein n=1 Tax=Ekhidna sp. TaxID=2608089 RepID=UPI0032EC4886